MTAVNILIFSSMIVKLHNIKNVVWIGVHVDVLPYMQMCEVRILNIKYYKCIESL